MYIHIYNIYRYIQNIYIYIYIYIHTYIQSEMDGKICQKMKPNPLFPCGHAYYFLSTT